MKEIIDRTFALLREGTLPVMLPLLVCALGIWFVFVERAIYFYGGQTFLSWFWPPLRARLRKVRRKLSDRLEDYLARPSPCARDEVLDLCTKFRNPYTSFVSRVVGEDAFVGLELKDLQLAEAAREEELRITRGLEILATLAKAAPLLGLLGTVAGMIQTFRVMMLSSTSDPRALSSGISIALIATEVGLAVSLPGVIGSSWLHRRAQTLLDEIHLVGMRMVQAYRSGVRKREEIKR